MKLDWVNYLCDLEDGTELRLAEITQQMGNRVIAGKLLSKSGHFYEIRHGIPVLITKRTQSLDSVKSFAYEWQEFGFLYAKNGWIQDIVNPLVDGLEFFRDKTIVDAGAGSGAQSRWMAEAGAKLVISLELSDAIFSVHRETIKGYEDVIFPIQCDIALPPLRIIPDVVYCVNTLQHTINPRQTFARLAKLTGENTVFLFNIYTKRSEFKFRLVRTVRRLIRVLPLWAWKWLAFLLSSIAYPLSKVPFLLNPIRIVMPMSHSFRETWLDVYDAFGAHHYQENMTRADQIRMIQDAGLAILREAKFGYVVARHGVEF